GTLQIVAMDGFVVGAGPRECGFLLVSGTRRVRASRDRRDRSGVRRRELRVPVAPCEGPSRHYARAPRWRSPSCAGPWTRRGSRRHGPASAAPGGGPGDERGPPRERGCGPPSAARTATALGEGLLPAGGDLAL